MASSVKTIVAACVQDNSSSIHNAYAILRGKIFKYTHWTPNLMIKEQ